jgi:hypothetical protein
MIKILKNDHFGIVVSIENHGPTGIMKNEEGATSIVYIEIL